MICQPDKHVWVRGATPTTCGERTVIYCGVCGLSQSEPAATWVQPTFEGYQTLRTAEDATGATL